MHLISSKLESEKMYILINTVFIPV